jgi:hypothetical protein
MNKFLQQKQQFLMKKINENNNKINKINDNNNNLMQDIFTNIYEEEMWGSNNNDEYKGSSGGGSDIELNKLTYIPIVKKFISDNNIKNIVDLGCGDFKCGSLIYDELEISYTGYDAYDKIIMFNQRHNLSLKFNFIHLDFYNKKEEIVNGDLCILKDVLQHWNYIEIYNFLDYLIDNKKFKYILICNCSFQAIDNVIIKNGEFTPLNCNFFPLKKYNPIELYNYSTKQISVINI